MNLVQYLFSFSGRINRAKQWALLLVAIGWEVIVGFAFAFTIGFGIFADLIQNKLTVMDVIASPQAHLFGIILLFSYFVVVYATLAITTKRLHDRNKSAWWLVVFMVLPQILNIPRYMEVVHMVRHFDELVRAAQAHQPSPFQESPLSILGGGAATLIGLWAFVELYCLRGTVGDNRYGPDPLAGRS